MGGAIWAESEVGRGSTIHFTARFEASEADPRLASPVSAGLRGAFVLVVDRHPTTRRVLGDLLEQWQMRPVVAGGVDEALEILNAITVTGPPLRLVLIDGEMPGDAGLELAAKIHDNPAWASATTIVMSSANHMQDVTRRRELGIAAHLIKPVRRADLRQAMERRQIDDGLDSCLQPAAVVREPVQPLRILLAEDNAVNQRLAVRLLEKYGHLVTTAGDGKEAVRAALRQDFDLVLMDVQMPEMSGLEAAAAIRDREKSTGCHVPIIALTARAMEGDRDECIEWGMDGYLSKPIQVQELLDAINKCIFTTSRSLVLSGL
jgi:two-component system sensor histidine kinase/response regulator